MEGSIFSLVEGPVGLFMVVSIYALRQTVAGEVGLPTVADIVVEWHVFPT